MYRIDGIYNSGYAHAPALIVNPSGSYPLIYNSTTGILQQTPNDQKVDKASEVEFKLVNTPIVKCGTSLWTSNINSVTGQSAVTIANNGNVVFQGPGTFPSILTATVKSITGITAATIDSAGNLLVANGLFSPSLAIGALQLYSADPNTSAVEADGIDKQLKLYATKRISIGIANSDFFSFEPASTLFPSPSFRLPSGASMWTSKINSVTGQPAITIADNGTVSIPSLSLPATGIFKALEVSNLPSQTGKFSITQPFNDNSFYIKTTSDDNSHSLDIYASSLRNKNGTGGLLLDNYSTTFLSSTNLFNEGLYIKYITNRLWYDLELEALNLTAAFKTIVSTATSKVELSGQSILLGTKVGIDPFTTTAVFSNVGIDFYKNVNLQGNINALQSSFVSVDANAYKLNGAAVTFPSQALNPTSSPTFAGLTLVPVSPSLKAPILTTSTEGAPTNSNPNGNGADLDVFDLRIRSGRIFTSAATLQLGKKFSCDKQFNITGNNAATAGETPYNSLRGAVQLQIGTTNYPTAIIVSNDTRVVSMENLQLTGLQALKAPSGVEAEFFTGSNLFANKWLSNPGGTSVQVEQAVATPTGPNFTNGIRVNNIKHPDGGLFINLNGPRPYFPEGFDAKLYPVDGGSEVTYNAAVNTFGYKPKKPDPSVTIIRFAQNLGNSYLDNSYDTQATVEIYVYEYYSPIASQRYKVRFGGNRGYPPCVENATTLIGGGNGWAPNVFVSFQAQTPFESSNFPNTWVDNVKQKFPSLGTYMITWNLGSFYDPRRVLLSINKNFNTGYVPPGGGGYSNMTATGNDPTALTIVENYHTFLENGTSITAIVNITSLSDYVTYSIYNYDARTFISGQGRNALSVVKVGQL
jgi:hypothetical protein